MIPPSFEYHRPETLDQAMALLAQYSEDAKVLAGGHSLLPMMKMRFAEPGHLIDLNRIPYESPERIWEEILKSAL